MLAAAVLAASPARAADCPASTACDTTVTFGVTAGALQITVPDAVALATNGPPGGFAYGPLGDVTVDDARASSTPSWTVTVASTSFTTGGAGTGEVIPNSEVYYCSGNASATTGTGVFTPGQPSPCDPPPPPSGVSLAVPQTAYTHTGGTGNNSATWNPLITISIPLSSVGGTYTGTISHTVV
ncbi:hypothetical protein [Micromonospora rifamycinica]|nr:hypothetical protein [Micromonospora rifamycinica]